MSSGPPIVNATTSSDTDFDANFDAGAHTPLLIAKGLCKTYADSRVAALTDVDITIYEGEIFGLLGPNGAGKTTCISILSTILSPSRGSVVIDSIDAFESARRVRKIIGLVPQDIALYEPLTARENLIYFGRLHALRGGVLQKRMDRALRMVGLSDQVTQLVHTFSGGMKRRLNLAVGILHQPRLLFLDEPTVGIDAQSRNLIMEQLQVLKQKKTTMLYTTHYMEEAELICDRVAIIDAGRVIAVGAPADLIKQTTDCDNLEGLFLKLTGKQLRD